MRRTSLLTAAALLGALLSALPAGPAAAAEEVHERPLDGTFEVEGRGWGHGRGMSQWGAQGAASLGRSADEITSTYYPGTQRAVVPNTPMRVWLSGDEGRDTAVFPAEGLAATDSASGATAVLPPGPSRWRVRADAAGLHLESLTGSAWTPYALGGATTHAGPVRFSGTTFTRVVFPSGASRDYRGQVTAVRDGSGLRTVVVLGLEDYLLGVVPREASAGWRPQALQAQAVAARSYSLNKRSRVKAGAPYDICDTTACQVFGGSRLYTAAGRVTELEPATTTDAVRATAGVVRTSGGVPIFAEFSSSNGGWSTKGDVAYLQARQDPWDGEVANPVHAWTASLPVAAIEQRFPAVGTLQRLRITRRDGNGEWGGRVREVVLEGTTGTVTTTGAGVYNAASWPGTSSGLRSTWFRIAPPSAGSAVVQQSAAPQLVRPPGASTGQVTAVLRNTGATAWPAEGLHLALAGGQADALAAGSTRPGRYTGTADVAPGQSATFAVALDASGVAAGVHPRTYRVRLGDGPLLGAGASWRFLVDDARFTASRSPITGGPTAKATSDAPPRVFADGRTVVVPRRGTSTVRLRTLNTGNVTWPGTGQVVLGTSGPRDRASTSAGTGWASASRAAVSSTPVAPGQVAGFDVVLHGGGRPVGVSFEQFEPVWAGRHWLDGAATRLATVRVDPDVARVAGLHSVPAALTVAEGKGAVLVVRLRNLGRDPWVVGKDVLQAAAAEPLRTAAWLSPTRPPALARNATRPSVQRVHPGEIGEWRVPLTGVRPGTTRTTLQPVVGGSGYGPRTTTTVTVR